MVDLYKLPKVSVIVTAYNCSQYIGEAIRSILEQTYPEFELIVVDDGSTDNTREIVSSFRDDRLKYIFQANKGPGSARNTGILESQGELVCFLDADDVWLPEKLEMQLKALETSPRAAVVYTDMYFFGAKGPSQPETFFQTFRWPPPRGRVLNQLADRNFGHPTVLMIKREVFDKVGLFDEKLKNCQDYDLMFRIAQYFEFEVVPVPLAKYRFHPNQISRNSESVFTSHIAFFNKALSSPFTNDYMRQTFRSRLAESHFSYGIFFARRGRLDRAIREFLASLRTDSSHFFRLAASVPRRIAARLFS